MKFSVVAAFVAAFVLAGAFTRVQADSPCQGRPRGACESDSRCVWVDGYKRNDGVQVDAYCRAKPGEGETKPEPKKETKKETKPEPKKETKKETKPEPKKETKKETKPEPKKETKPEPKKETKPEPKKETN